MDHALKFTDGSEDQIEGMLCPNGGIFNGRDATGEYFSVKTDYALDLFPDRPLMFHHGLDPAVEIEAVGRIKSLTPTDKGLWMQAWLDRRSEWYESIKKMIGEKNLELSSGSLKHLVRVANNGEILRWPVAEGSLTATPACPGLAHVDFATAESHFKSAGIDVDFEALKARMTAAERDALPDSDFAYIDSDGKRSLPINDADHVRAALSRFDQTEFASDAAKEKARAKIEARAKELGVDVSQDDNAAKKSASIKSLDGSYEDLIEDLCAALNPASPFGSEGYTCIVATFPTYVIASRYDTGEDESSYWRVEYTLDDAGEPVLGKATEVEQTYVPAKSFSFEGPLSLDAQSLTRHATALVHRTQGLHERRVEEHRSLSAGNRRHLGSAIAEMAACTKALQTLLDTTSEIEAACAKAEALSSPEGLRRRVAALSLVMEPPVA